MNQPHQPTKRRGPLPWILGGVAVMLLLCVGVALLGSLIDNQDDAAGAPTQTTAAVGSRAPVAADFKLTAKITEQTCYGEAGCAVTWRPEVTYSGPAIASGQTWTVSYAVSGVESGTKVGTIVVDSKGPAKQNVKRGRTAGEDSKITLKVTSIDKS